MRKIILIALTAIAFTSCKKDDTIPYNANEPLLGNWQYKNDFLQIDNLTGEPTPYYCTKKGDSLFVVLQPTFNYRFKVISVDEKNLIVSDSVTKVFTRVK